MQDASTMLDCMNCHPIKSVSDLPGGREWVIEPKLDGFRLLARVNDKDVEFYTRSKKPQAGKLPHIERELLATFPPGTVLDGEIVSMTHGLFSTVVNDFEWVQSVMLSKQPRSVSQQESTGRWLQYVVFDMMQVNGHDIRDQWWMNRVSALGQQLANADLKYVQQLPNFPASDLVHEKFVETGWEGSVVKDKMGKYISGARGVYWFKNKEQPTVDCVIVGYKPGKGKFKDLVGAVHFGQPFLGSPLNDMDPEDLPAFVKKHKIEMHAIDGVIYVERGHASGMDDRERLFMTNNKDALLGTVIEVGHNGIFPNKVKMRHPQFLRFRDDKPASAVHWHNS